MASEITVKLRIKPWWLALLRVVVALRLTRIALWLAHHPAFEVQA